MTDSKTYDVLGADVIITVATYPSAMDVHITLDTTKLDAHLPEHSPHQLLGNYLYLRHYETGESCWWCKVKRTVRVRTGSQARRVIRRALAKIEDALHDALRVRESRMQEGRTVLA